MSDTSTPYTLADIEALTSLRGITWREEHLARLRATVKALEMAELHATAHGNSAKNWSTTARTTSHVANTAQREREEWRLKAETAARELATMRAMRDAEADAVTRCQKEGERQAECIKALEAWQLAVADGLGFVNRAEGQSGYEVAAPSVILAHVKALEEAVDEASSFTQARVMQELEKFGLVRGATHDALKAELAAESALVATLQDSLSAAQVAHHETAQERDAARQLFASMVETATKNRAEADRWKADYERACELVAKMHAAAVGDVRGPSVGPVEDVAALAQERDRLKAAATKAEEWMSSGDAIPVDGWGIRNKSADREREDITVELRAALAATPGEPS